MASPDMPSDPSASNGDHDIKPNGVHGDDIDIYRQIQRPPAPPEDERQHEDEEREPGQQQAETLEGIKQSANARADEYDNLLKLFSDFCETTEFHDPKLKDDFEGDYLTVAKGFLKRMEGIARALQEDKKDRKLFLSSDALGKVLEQLDGRKVYLCAVGRTNMGKSKTLNVLMNNDALPVKSKAETAAAVHIESKPEEGQPRLLVKDADPIVGSEEISKYLHTLRERTRDKQLGRSKFTLQAHIPIFANTSQPIRKGFSLILVDTPGSNEVGEETLQRLAEDNITSATALLYFMKYDDLANKTDYEPLQKAYRYDEALFTQHRLTIVVTHYDKYFEDDKDEGMDLAEVKKVVVDSLRKINLIASDDAVVPISTKWAHQAQKCIQSNGVSKKENEAVLTSWLNLQQHVEACRGEDWNLLDEAKEKPSVDAAREINDASNFKELERRLVKTASQLEVLWSRNLLVRCREFADLIHQDLEKCQKDLFVPEDKLIAANMATILCREIIFTLRRGDLKESGSLEGPGNLEGSGGLERPHLLEGCGSFENIDQFLESLQDAYKKDIDKFYEKTIHPAYEKEKDDFVSLIKEGPSLMPEKWKSEVDKFRQRVHNMLQEHVKVIQFKECPLLLKKHQLSINRKVGRLQGIASVMSTIRPGTLYHVDDAEKRTQDDADFEQLHKDIKPEQLPHINPHFAKVNFLEKWIAVYFGLKNIVRDEDIDDVTKRTESACKDSYNNLVNDNEPGKYKEKVLVHYLKKYCDETCVVLNKFKTENVPRQVAIKKVKAQRMLRSKCKCWQDHVVKVMDKLDNVYRHSLTA